jgi:sugar O-acyltransferase (sialic acid O-acetyltransferase NeuD family)
MNPLYAVFGAGGCGRGVMPLARAQCADVKPDRFVFVDDASIECERNGHRVLGWDDFLKADASMRAIAVAVADPAVRTSVVARCEAAGIPFLAIRAANVVEMDDVILGEGAILSPFVTLTSNIRIGRHFHANLYSCVEHDCVIGDFVTFAPGVRCNGNVHIGDRAYIGAGAILRQGRPGAPLEIGAGAVVGMGAVVTRSVAPGAVVVGNPARPLRGG